MVVVRVAILEYEGALYKVEIPWSLIDDDDMARQRKQICSGQFIAFNHRHVQLQPCFSKLTHCHAVTIIESSQHTLLLSARRSTHAQENRQIHFPSQYTVQISHSRSILQLRYLTCATSVHVQGRRHHQEAIH